MSDKNKKDYRDSLNLPEAKNFPMKAGLIRKEPEIQKEWEKIKLFSAVREKSKTGNSRKSFVLHDGPPYANGSIHIGHLLNKILKDLVVRSKTMEGYDCFLVPGWDCHGLPIEHKVLKESDDITAETDPVLIRKKCRNYADKFVRKQTKEMKRLGTIADYENPYLTMEPEYEAGVLEVFAELVRKNIVRHDLKPVHWSVENKTALAEAELEYHERTDPSVYALFPIADTARLPKSLNVPEEKNISLLIWTTTPWTLPANLAVAISPDAKYGLYKTIPSPPGRGARDEGKKTINPNLLTLARKLRKEHTDAEKLLWQILRDKQLLGFRFRRQHPVAPYVLDFYCHERRIAIELDGGQHNEPDRRAKDKERTKFLEKKGITVIRFWNNEVLQKTEGVAERLYDALTPPLSRGERESWVCVVAEGLAETVFGKIPEIKTKKLGSCSGSDLLSAGTTYKHPFIEREGRVVGAAYVATDEGTGLVHTAPGHGAEDYTTGIKEGLDIYCPVLEDGTFDSSVPDWLEGKNIWEGNGLVVEKLRDSGLLFHSEDIVHSYPHDWRGKTPTIFRATEQWFIKMDEPAGEGGKTLRQMALENINEKIKFHPEWGQRRFAGMLESRPDWCISRQRSWGLPIPAFTDAEGNILMTRQTVLAVAEKIRAKGSNFWFEAETAELLEGYDPEKDSDAPQWTQDNWNLSELKKGSDIFDVWFESGSSWHSVIKKGEQKKADLYLEGSDQHRGWFQSSLLTSLGATGKPPFEQILTHGFMVDAQGKKMSKSVGNALEVEEVLKQYGADVCRWWVSSLNYSNDVKTDIKIIEAAADEYRTVRNTIRFLLSNLNDFNPETDSVPLTDEDEDVYSVNNIATIVLKHTINNVLKAYSEFEYRYVSRSILSFCDMFLSKDYIGTVRDRLYCDKADSKRRRKTQTVIYKIADTLIKLCAPILVHTSEEAYSCLIKNENTKAKSVHLTKFPKVEDNISGTEKEIRADYDDIEGLKEKCLLSLELAKNCNKDKKFSNPLDTGILIIAEEAFLEANQSIKNLSKSDFSELSDFVGISRIHLQSKEDSDEDDIVEFLVREQPIQEKSTKRDNPFRKIKTEDCFKPDLITTKNISPNWYVVGVYDLSSQPKCERCWKRDKTSSKRADGGTLCNRCADAVGL